MMTKAAKTNQPTNESKIPYATHYVFDVCFHRFTATVVAILAKWRTKGEGRELHVARYENHFSALYSHDMQAKRKGKG